MTGSHLEIVQQGTMGNIRWWLISLANILLGCWPLGLIGRKLKSRKIVEIWEIVRMRLSRSIVRKTYMMITGDMIILPVTNPKGKRNTFLHAILSSLNRQAIKTSQAEQFQTLHKNPSRVIMEFRSPHRYPKRTTSSIFSQINSSNLNLKAQ